MDIPGILGGISIVHPVLEKVKRNTEGNPKLLVEAKFSEAKEVFANVFSKVAAHKLFASIIEGTHAICTGVGVECWSE